MKSKLLQLTDAAKKLYELRQFIAKTKEEHKLYLAPFEAKEEAQEQTVVTMMEEAQVKTFRVENGDVFFRGLRSSFKAVTGKAIEWAIEKGVVSVDMRKAQTLLRREIHLPEGFERVDTPFLTIKHDATED